MHFQREEELKAEQENFESQLRNMFAKCAQLRRTSAPAADTGVENLLEQSRKTRENGAQQTPIQEVNGHDETEPVTNC